MKSDTHVDSLPHGDPQATGGKNEPAHTFIEGDPIWYRHVPRGGYGFGSDVPGTFVKRTARRVVVRCFLKSGKTKDVSVFQRNVRPRDPEAIWR
jgi:hypothetical protein